MKSLILFLVLYCLTVFSASAQKEANHWYFGDHADISFQTSLPAPRGDGQINTREGCASISDKITGALLFYTDGVKVWNSNHQIMSNGTGLKGGTSSSQSALIVPNPANNLQYYIFTAPDLSSGTGITSTALYYSLVSLEIPGGEVLSKNVLLIDSVAEKLTGTKDCSGTGFWVVTHHTNNNTFYSFHITNTGINLTPVVSSYNEGIRKHRLGCIKISPNASKIALASSDNFSSEQSLLALLDFNATSGDISNYMPLSYSFGAYGVSFSPDNTKLYATGATGSPFSATISKRQY